jgi:hypothetical protein
VSKAGFSKAEVKDQVVLVGQATTVDITLEVGQISEVVEVKTVAGAELQTLNSTMGQTITNEGMMDLPIINRDAGGLLFLQPTVAPTMGGMQDNITSGQVAGNMSDQNTYLLDGGNATSDFDGDNGVYVGSRSAVIPTPMESIEEVRVNTNNMTADFGLSGGGQMLLNTKRGQRQTEIPLQPVRRIIWRTGGAIVPGRQDVLLHELRRGTISPFRALRENRSFAIVPGGDYSGA